jgi:enterochelin esterase family protein
VGKDDFLLEPNKKFVSWLEAQHVPHTWTISDGGHQWPVWRKYLGEFLPLLFR